MPLPSFLGSRQEGAAYNGHTWEMAPLPAPDVIYNRCHSRKMERSPSFQGALSRFEKKKIHVFNRGFLSKDEVYAALKDSPVISAHLPETVNGLDSLEEMLASCNDVFVKAVDGSRGRYILRIQKRERDYLVHQNSFGAKSPLTFSSQEALLRQIKLWCRRSSYLVQETISFVKVDGCSLDFRYLCHLDENGTWQIVSSVARVSSPHQFVANVDQGGVIEKPAAILQTLFPEKAVEISNEMKKLCIATARLLADSIDGHFAELGMDIGIDGSGKPWLIEVNAKPSKRTYTEASAIRPSVKSLYAYSYRKWIHKED
ncbi:hypothetical protein KH172YL63_10430 [Bacillus sp. KH172YL63]|nr:hypothetical protein KH172YL63_10430 [Bacillus sp. KH172YL63]